MNVNSARQQPATRRRCGYKITESFLFHSVPQGLQFIQINFSVLYSTVQTDSLFLRFVHSPGSLPFSISVFLRHPVSSTFRSARSICILSLFSLNRARLCQFGATAAVAVLWGNVASASLHHSKMLTSFHHIHPSTLLLRS
jgi:hypothetical protein